MENCGEGVPSLGLGVAVVAVDEGDPVPVPPDGLPVVVAGGGSVTTTVWVVDAPSAVADKEIVAVALF